MFESLTNDLAHCIQGEVKTDLFSRKIYSIDASIYQIEPVGVVCPKDCGDLEQIVAFAKRNHVPIIPRGAGTGIAGGCIGEGVVIDLSKYMNQILEINYDEHYAICQPGVVQDRLNSVLLTQGYRLGPDTSTGNRATIGGMMGNNASGSHSLCYGKMVDNVLETDLILADGSQVRFGAEDDQSLRSKMNRDDSISNIYRTVQVIRENLTEEVRRRYPKIQRRVSGYNLDALVNDHPLNLAKLITGSEGTLGIATEIKVKICRSPSVSGICVLNFKDLIAALEAVELVLEFEPFAVELIDKNIIESARNNPEVRDKIAWLNQTPAAMLIVEFAGESKEFVANKLAALKAKVKNCKSSPSMVQLMNPTAISDVWKVRKAGLGLLMARRTNERAVAFLEDIAVPVARLSQFIDDFRSYIRDSGKEAGFYGHAGVGCIHVRPMLDLRKGQDIEVMVKMMEDISDLVLSYGGALSGEHGDGLVRSWLNEKMFGPNIYQAFKAIKSAFDPQNLMNPGKIVNAQGPRENLRGGPKIQASFDTIFDFKDQGGFEFALSMCNGNGECRKTTSGTMCPSFHVTNDERDTTRARAQSLLAMLSEGTSDYESNLKEVYEILDLCLECKGCKRECPSQVDMAAMKAEFLYHYYQTHKRPIRDRIFGSIDLISRIGCMLAPFSNQMIRTNFHRKIMDWIGIDRRRELPGFAAQRFSTWFRNRKVESRNTFRDKVVLFVDTFTEYNYPEIGKAAVTILDQLNCDIAITNGLCCGRALISKGLLGQAKIKATKVVRILSSYVENGYRIIGLEPSCILTLKDEYPALINKNKALKIAKACSSMDLYLDELLGKGTLDLSFRSKPADVRIHGHCHQKAIDGLEPSVRVLQAVPGLSVDKFNSGCCGMAGSFGYEREHYDFSIKIAETRLVPAIRACGKETLLVANGVSCRQQIKHTTNQDAKHLISILAERLI